MFRLTLSRFQQLHPFCARRGSAYYLRDSADSFHVFVYAPFEERVRRLQQEGKSEQEAIKLAETIGGQGDKAERTAAAR